MNEKEGFVIILNPLSDHFTEPPLSCIISLFKLSSCSIPLIILLTQTVKASNRDPMISTKSEWADVVE